MPWQERCKLLLIVIVLALSIPLKGQESAGGQHYYLQQMYTHAPPHAFHVPAIYGQLDQRFLEMEPTWAASSLMDFHRYWQKQGKPKLAYETLWQAGMVKVKANQPDQGKSLIEKGLTGYLELPLLKRDFDRLFILVNWLYSHRDEHAYARKLLYLMQEAIQRKAPGRLLDFHFHLGYIEQCLSNYHKSLEHYSVLLKEDSLPPMSDFKGSALCYSGWNHRYLGNYDKAIDFFEQYYQYSKQAGHERECMDANRYLANIHELQGQYVLALERYFSALEYYRQNPDEESIAWTLNAIGSVFKKMDENASARAYLTEAYQTYRHLGIKYGIAMCLRDLGKLYLAEGEVDSALHYLNAARKIRMKSKSMGYAEVLNLCAKANYMNGATTKAVELLMEAYQVSAAANEIKEQNASMVLLGQIVMNMDDQQRTRILSQINFDHLEDFLLRAHQLSNAHNNAENTLHTLELLRDYYKMANRPSLALRFYEEYTIYHDSIFDARHMLAIKNMESMQHLKEKEQQIALLENAKKMQALEIEKQKELKQKTQFKWLAILLLVVGIGYLLFMRYRMRQKRIAQRKQLEEEKREELVQMKNRFFANMTHEFKTPLTLIEAPVASLLQKMEATMDRQLLGIIKRNSQRLKRLSNQMLQLSKIQEGQIKIHKRDCNLTELVRSVYYDFVPYANDKGIDFQLDVPPSVVVANLDWEKIEEVAFNLISNAIKFTHSNKVVAVTLCIEHDQIVLKVADQGEGMSPAMLRHIFDRFYTKDHTANNNKGGTGLGLSICHEYVQLHGGHINVNSEEDVGTTFTVVLPVDYHLKSQFAADTRSAIEEEIPVSSSQVEGEGATLLLVEDNPDLRVFIARSVLPGYDIQMAVNGREGMEMAKTYQPDIIISDIMMPDVDGHQMLAELKGDYRTDHIPFIFLTAKSLPHNRVFGLKQGADAYIEKPFEPEELKYWVRNILNRQEQMRQRYQHALQENRAPAEWEDSPFLRKVKALVYDHLDNPQFSVSQMGQLLGLSRSQLHRKIRALTGMGPNPLIRSIRLNKAYEMLKEEDLSISEIGYRTGFSSPSYFTKCFREYFDFAPSNVTNTTS